jgi:hypothetical protein
MWIDLGIWGHGSFVWEDVFDGSEGDHVQGEDGAGGVEAVGPVMDAGQERRGMQGRGR